MSEWQPIETAPKTEDEYGYGPPILGWDGSYMTTVQWDPDSQEWWLIISGSYAEDCDWTPTHWMPLPSPPNGLRETP
jgi:hypothetical protein